MASRYTDPIVRILNAYQPGSPGLVVALEAFLKTVVDSAQASFKDELAITVCEGLHNGPATGLKCRACYEAEVQVPMLLQLQAEKEAAEKVGQK